MIDGKVESRMNLLKNPIAGVEAKQIRIGQYRCCPPKYGDLGNNLKSHCKSISRIAILGGPCKIITQKPYTEKS